VLLLQFQTINQIDRIKETDTLAVMDRRDPKRCCQVGFAGPRTADQDKVVRLGSKFCARKLFDMGLR